MLKQDFLDYVDKNYDTDDEIICILWSKADIEYRCEELGVDLTDEEQYKILRLIDKHKSAAIGINWDVIDSYIIDFISDKN